MKAENLKVGDKFIYNEEDKPIVKVISIDKGKQILRLTDKDDYEWDEPFTDIPDSFVRMANHF